MRKPVPSALSSVYRKTSKGKLSRLSSNIWSFCIFFAFSGVGMFFCRSWVINHCLLMTAYIAMQKHEDDQYLDGMSPPSSANESETLQLISLSNNPTNFQSRFPPAMSDIDHDDDDSFMDDEDMGGDSHEERSGTVSLPDFHLHYFFIFLSHHEKCIAVSGTIVDSCYIGRRPPRSDHNRMVPLLPSKR